MSAPTAEGLLGLLIAEVSEMRDTLDDVAWVYTRPMVAMVGSVTKVTPPITPARPARPQPLPNTSMKTRGTLWPSDSAISGWVKAA